MVAETLRENFRSLAECPRELWLAYGIKFLECYSYFSFSMLCVLYLSDELGLTDVEAGFCYGVSGGITGVAGLLIGFVVDGLGVRWGLVSGFTILTVSRLLLAVTTSVTVVKFVLFVLIPVGCSLGMPVLTMGIKRYTTDANRGFAFGMFYAVMNVACLLSGEVVDLMEIRFNGGMEIFGTHFSPRRLIMLSGCVTSAVALVISAFIREIRVGEGAEVEEFVVERAQPPWVVMAEVASMPQFWRFMGITVICVNLKMIFRHLDALLPTYLVREFGPHVPKGSIASINPALIIPLVPIVAALTSTRDHLDMIHFGSYISGMSALPLALHTSIPSAICFVVVLSIGETIWSPRFYDLTVSMAPEGREGMFIALGSAPLFVAKFPAGILSGFLLDTYCHKDGPRQSQTMWLIVWALTMSSPFLLSLSQCWLHQAHGKDQGEESQSLLELEVLS